MKKNRKVKLGDLRVQGFLTAIEEKETIEKGLLRFLKPIYLIYSPDTLNERFLYN